MGLVSRNLLLESYHLKCLCTRVWKAPWLVNWALLAPRDSRDGELAGESLPGRSPLTWQEFSTPAAYHMQPESSARCPSPTAEAAL